MIFQAAKSGSTSAGLDLLRSLCILIDRFSVGQRLTYFSTQIQTVKRLKVYIPVWIIMNTDECVWSSRRHVGIKWCSISPQEVQVISHLLSKRRNIFFCFCVVNDWPEIKDFPRAYANASLHFWKSAIAQYFDLFTLSGVMSTSPKVSLTAIFQFLLLMFM